jgi:hypothetical protein
VKRLLAALALGATVLGATTGMAFAGLPPYQDGGATQAIGGGLTSNNGQLDLTVPANAYALYTALVATGNYTGNTTIRLRYSPNSANNLGAPPVNTIWIGEPFTLQLSEWDTGAVISLDKPMTMAVHYKPSDLGGRVEASLRIVRLSGAGTGYASWVSLPSTVDNVNHVVRTQTVAGGDYGLIADNGATPGQSNPGASMISGRVFYDKTGNGVMDGGDFPIATAGVRISAGNWNAFTTTDANGNYSFGGLSAGSYTVELAVGPEWAFTTSNAVTNIQVTGQTDSRVSADFGMWYKLP